MNRSKRGCAVEDISCSSNQAVSRCRRLRVGEGGGVARDRPDHRSRKEVRERTVAAALEGE